LTILRVGVALLRAAVVAFEVLLHIGRRVFAGAKNTTGDTITSKETVLKPIFLRFALSDRNNDIDTGYDAG
jgi:hypothetical protein